MPPLRERKDDILLLVNHFVEKYSKSMGREIRRVSTPAINMLTAYHWPGNVRELENCIEHAILLANNGVIHGHDLPPTLQMPEMLNEKSKQASMKSTIMVVEKDMIVDSLKRSNGNICAAARELGITGRMVRYKIEKLGIDYQKLFKKKKKS
jgi:Nif-specific regulatory protein